MYHTFIQSSVSGYLGCFHVLTIVNCVAMNTEVCMSFQIMVFSRYMLMSETAGHMVALSLIV